MEPHVGCRKDSERMIEELGKAGMRSGLCSLKEGKFIFLKITGVALVGALACKLLDLCFI